MPNLGHAVPLVVAKGSESSVWSSLLGAFEMTPFSTGPAVMEALAAGELDAAYMGPPPVINAFVRARLERPRVLAGAALGGASLVVRRGLDVSVPSDLRGRTIASPQIGNTQDVALRAFLDEAGVVSRDRGGDTSVIPLSNADAFELLKRGQLDAAWAPEPWATRMVVDGGASRALDERTLWAEGRFPTVVLAVARSTMLTARGAVDALLEAHRTTTTRLSQASDAPDEVGAAMSAVLGKKLPISLLREAWRYFELSTDPCVAALEITASRMKKLGYLPSSIVEGIIIDPPAQRAESTR